MSNSPNPQRAHTPRQQQQHTPGGAPSEGEILRKQLQLTQALLDEELRKNHNLRRDIARLSSASGTVRIGGLGGRPIWFEVSKLTHAKHPYNPPNTQAF